MTIRAYKAPARTPPADPPPGPTAPCAGPTGTPDPLPGHEAPTDPGPTTPAEPLVLGPDFSMLPATMEHQSFIFDAWCSCQAMEPRFRDVPRDIFKVEMRARILRLLTLGKAAVVTPTRAYQRAHNFPYDPGLIWAFAAYDWDRQTECPIVHFIYVKPPWRRRGLARTLLREAAGVRVEGRTWWATHSSTIGRKIIRQMDGTFNDFMIEALFARKRPGQGRSRP